MMQVDTNSNYFYGSVAFNEVINSYSKTIVKKIQLNTKYALE